MTVRVLCRADASHFLGVGHVMRCLTLADEIRRNDGTVIFVCRAHTGHLADYIKERGFACCLLDTETDTILGANPADDAAATANIARQHTVDWVLVDHYDADAAWEEVQPVPVMAIDDLTNRSHAVTILLNQNLGADPKKYTALVAEGTTYLMGPHYALLRPEFADLRAQATTKRTSGGPCHIMISMGGSDQPNATGWVLHNLEQMSLPTDTALTIVMGPTAVHFEAIRGLADSMPYDTTVLSGATNIGVLMASADIAIGAGGSTAWERCCLMLPTVIVILAENQRQIGRALDAHGAAITVDLGQDDAFKAAVSHLYTDLARREEMAHKAANLVDGLGARRVFQALAATTKSTMR